MKKINQKLVKAIVMGIVFAAPYSVQAAEYDSAILGSKDNYGSEIKTSEDNNYTYTFNEDSTLKLANTAPVTGLGITADNKGDKSITVESGHRLDIVIENSGGDRGNYNGIAIKGNGVQNKVIDRSGGGNITITMKDNVGDKYLSAYGTAISEASNNTIKLGDSNIKIDIIGANNGCNASGIAIYEGNNNIIEMGSGKIEASAEANATTISHSHVSAYGVDISNKNTVKMDKVDIEVVGTGCDDVMNTDAYGLSAAYGATIITTGGDITATAKNDNDQKSGAFADGVFVNEGYVKKTTGSIKAIAEGTGMLSAVGVKIIGEDDSKGKAEFGIVDICAKTIGGNVSNDTYVDAIGVWADEASQFTMAGGSISASAVDENGAEKEGAGIYAILSDGSSTVAINQGTENKVNINGKVESRGTSKIDLTMNTADSNLNGVVNDKSKGISLEFANGATWNNNGASKVTNLTMNGGVINQDGDANHSIKVDNYSGTGDVVFKTDGVGDDGTLNITSGGITINNAAENSVVNIGVAGDKVDSFDLSKAQASLEELANQIKFNGTDENLSGTVKLEEGLISSEVSGDVSFNQNDNVGHVDVDSIEMGEKETATMRAMRDIASTAIVAWRQEDSTLSQRLGELRNSEGDQGIWTRMSRGEFEYDGAYKNQYNFFQLGYDKAYGDWHYGAAISYNDGKTAYAEGNGENSSTSLSLYGTWLGDKGHYADIVLKQGRLSNEFDTYAVAGHTHGDYDAWGTSLSGEYGRKTELNDGWYVTPQAQLTLMRIGGESYTTDNGIAVDQETLNSAVGRIGFEIGKAVNDKGAVYAKASMLHEFAGNADTYLSLNGIHNSYSQDIGGTWYEAGIGLSYKTSSDTYIYADVVKTFGGDVETPWQWNAGVRYSF